MVDQYAFTKYILSERYFYEKCIGHYKSILQVGGTMRVVNNEKTNQKMQSLLYREH